MTKKETTLIVLVAMPGAGKTKYANEVLLARDPDALILSSDDIRWTMQGGNGEDASKTIGPYKYGIEHHVQGVVEFYARGCLGYGRSVIIDSTNLKKAERQEKIAWAREWGAKARCIHLKISKEESIKRSPKIPHADISSIFDRYEEPTIDEGWDYLDVIDMERQNSISKWW